MPPPPQEENKQASANTAVNILQEISEILNCHLDRRELSICISLIERGVNPEALATTIKELRKAAQDAEIELEARKQQ